MKTNIYNGLLKLGATVLQEPTVSPDRLKSHGRMWDGKARVEFNKEVFWFELWHHGGSEETVASLLPEFSLRGINSERIGYDCNWNTVITPKGILYYDKDGWFRNSELRDKIGSHNNYFPDRITDQEIERLLSIGMQWFLEFKQEAAPKEKLELKSRIAKPTLKELHAMGWTKNHLRFDVHCVGKWRSMGYFQGEKAFKRTFDDAPRRIALASGIPIDRFTILAPDKNNVVDETTA